MQKQQSKENSIQQKREAKISSNQKEVEQPNNKQKQQQVEKNEDQDDQENDQEQNEEDQQDEEPQRIQGKWKKIEEPQKSVNLYMIDFGHCDVKKCSGKKLQRFKLLTNFDKKKKFKGIVLSAFGKKEVSNEDLQYATKYGVCVIDCSWNRIQETKDFRYKHQRKLPYVVAGNPVNYGKPYQLSCAEALATSLCTIGYIQQAEYIMSKFGWADGFWSQNKSIQNYSKCKTLQDLRAESKVIQQSGNQIFQRNYDFSSDSSDQQ